MTDDYPEPPRTDWGGLALLSEADDPEDYRDIHGAVIDQENWEEIKHKILEEGTYAERPESAPFDGAKYHAKDINVTFAWDADAAEWVALNTGAGDTPVPGETHLEALRTEEAQFNQSVTWPDGSTTTTSPEGGGKLGDLENEETGFLEPKVADRPTLQMSRSRPPQRSLFSWHFDDARYSVYEHRDVFLDHDVAPGVAATTYALDTGTFAGDIPAMEWDDLHEMVEEGSEVLNHSKEHYDFDDVGEEEIHEDVYESTRKFLDEGIVPTNYVYAYHSTGGDLGKGVVAELYPYAFGGDGGNATPLQSDNDPHDLYRLDTDNTSADDIKSVIDEAISQGVGMVLFGHDIIDAPEEEEGALEVSKEKIDEILQYVKDQGGEWVNSSEEVIQKSSRRPWRIGGPNGSIYNTGAWLTADFEGANGFQVRRGGTRYLGIREDNPFELHSDRGFDIYHAYNDFVVDGDYNSDFIVSYLGEDKFVVSPNNDRIELYDPAYFDGVPQTGIDTTGSTPTDDTTPAAYEEIEGDDGETYYRPLYQ